ncbi:hypothetical protein MP638_005586 [Amoeboaphelidium occidentale]|nr:hypothetical protein MP638_005586 [Amoeboaphelidium occidentale]
MTDRNSVTPSPVPTVSTVERPLLSSQTPPRDSSLNAQQAQRPRQPQQQYTPEQIRAIREQRLREMTPEQRRQLEEEWRMQQARAPTDAEELKYYVEQIYHIVKPVIACIILSVFWVKTSLNGSDFRPVQSGFAVYNEESSASTEDRLAGSLLNAAIIIGVIIAATVLFVVMFKYGCRWFLYLYLFASVVLLLGFIGFLLLLNLIQVYSVPVDYITIMFALWNFAAGGVAVIFWRGNLWIQQAYLVVMSSMMAFSLNGLQAWTTWLLLGALAIWDLVAVLCPYGPLRILVNTAREENREIPALLYSVTMVWVGMADDSSIGGKSKKSKRGSEGSSPIPMSDIRAQAQEDGETLPGEPMKEPPSGIKQAESKAPLLEEKESDPEPPRSDTQQAARPAAAAAPQNPNNEEQQEEEDDEKSGLKLGLGDFIFYSVLIARCSMEDWVTTIACFIAVMAGLNATIFLLAIYKKALPALPISIAFGILFYFISSFLLSPFVQQLFLDGVII